MNRSRIPLLLAWMILSIACNKDFSAPHKTARDTDESIDYPLVDAAYADAKALGRVRYLIVSFQDSFYRGEYFRADARTTPHNVMSVTKSVTSLLIGIAIDKGFIPSVDVPIGPYIRPLVDSLDQAKAAITIRQLLTMSCGLAWSEIPGPSEFMDWWYASDQLLYILDKPFTSQPGQVFNYSDGAAHLASIVLTQATGMKAQAFANTYVFAPLEIEERTWTADNRGFNFGGVRLYLLPDDMIKIGKLMLAKGACNGVQVVSGNWIEESTDFQISVNNVIPYSSSYGYYWWRGRAHGHDYYFANGWAGQFILIVPQLHLIVATTTDYSGLNDDGAGTLWHHLMTIIIHQVLPAFR